MAEEELIRVNNMRKTLLTLSLLAGIAIGAKAQQGDTLKFMNDCREIMAYLEAQPQMTKQQVDSLGDRLDTLRVRYHQVKPQLNNAQVEEYNTMKGRYTKKVLAYRGDRISDGLQNTGDSIAKAASRVGKSVGGFFKGLFNE